MIELLEHQRKLTANQWKLIVTGNLADLLDFFDFFWVKSHFSHLEEHVSEASSGDGELVRQRRVGGGCSATHIRPRRVAAGMAESLPSQPSGASDSPRNPPGR